MKINDWCKYIHKWAKKKGFWSVKERGVFDSHMLIVSEIAEATEEVRKGKPPLYFVKPRGFSNNRLEKPEGEAVELADAVIRIMDLFGKNNWDLEKILKLKMEYNEKRPYMHGNKII